MCGLGIILLTDLLCGITSYYFSVDLRFDCIFKDLGRANLVEHEIKHTDDTPFKDPYRRIPPAMYEEVRQHLKEMLEAGAIRKSQSPYCSNVVLCRKSDGSLRFCIDLRKLNNKTVKDA